MDIFKYVFDFGDVIGQLYNALASLFAWEWKGFTFLGILGGTMLVAVIGKAILSFK